MNATCAKTIFFTSTVCCWINKIHFWPKSLEDLLLQDDNANEWEGSWFQVCNSRGHAIQHGFTSLNRVHTSHTWWDRKTIVGKSHGPMPPMMTFTLLQWLIITFPLYFRSILWPIAVCWSVVESRNLLFIFGLGSIVSHSSHQLRGRHDNTTRLFKYHFCWIQFPHCLISDKSYLH